MKHSQYSAHFWARLPEMLCSLSAREEAPISPAVFRLESQNSWRDQNSVIALKPKAVSGLILKLSPHM